jgi:hypothetical protein
MPFARVRELAMEYPLAPLAFLTPALALIRKNSSDLRAASAAFAIGMVLFSLMAGSASELRLSGALLPLSGLLVGLLVAKVVCQLPLRAPLLPWILLLLLSLALPYRWSALSRARTLHKAHELTRSYITGEAQGWFRDNFKPGMRAALLVESRSYHSLPYPIVRPWDSPTLDAILRPSPDAKVFLDRLKREGFTHLIVSQEKLDLFYPKELVSQVEQYVLSKENEGALVYQSPFSMVADLQRLK